MSIDDELRKFFETPEEDKDDPDGGYRKIAENLASFRDLLITEGKFLDFQAYELTRDLFNHMMGIFFGAEEDGDG